MKTKTLIGWALGSMLILGTVAAAEVGHARHSTSTGERFGLGRPLPPGWEPAVHDSVLRSFVIIERGEFRTGDLADAAVLDAEGWVGGDYHRFWWKLEGEQLTKSPKDGELEVAALYSRVISPFWEAQIGLRLDRAYSGRHRETRGHAVVGLEGLAPYWFEIEPSLAISDQGKLSFNFTATYELLLTQRLVLEPRLELRLDQERQEEVRGFVGKGTNDLDFGLRLRYDVRRSFSPYVGVEWHRPVGASSGVARRGGKGGWQSAFVFGLRTWF
jgi:copper resistance protein B